MPTLEIVVYPSEDLPGQWIGRCLDTNVISQGNSPEHALEMIWEAQGLTWEGDLSSGLDPFRHRVSPEECSSLRLAAEIRSQVDPVALTAVKKHTETIRFPWAESNDVLR